MLSSSGAKKDVRVGFFTDGADWSSAYDVILGAKDARVTGRAVVASRTLAAEEAEVQLLAGAVSRVQRPVPRPVDMMKAREMAMAADAGLAPQEERAGEFHLYTLPGKVTLRPGATTSVALFDPATAAYERRYVVRGIMPIWGFVPPMPDETQTPVASARR